MLKRTGKWLQIAVMGLLLVGGAWPGIVAETAHAEGSGTILYVKQDGSDSSSGLGWDNAFATLQKALDEADPSGGLTYEIWIAAGTYYPTKEIGGTGDRYRTFQMKNGVAIYGGFAGNEAPETFNLAQRNISENKVTLSGDIGIPGDGRDNVYHVFYHPNGLSLTSDAILDGVTITGGNASDAPDRRDGGGMYNEYSSPALTHVTISGNMAHSGGGIFNSYSSPALKHSVISGNRAVMNGGGMYSTTGNPILQNVTISGNYSLYGGGIYMHQSGFVQWYSLTISGNMAHTGLELYSHNSDITLINSIVWSQLSYGIPEDITERSDYSWGGRVSTYSSLIRTSSNNDPLYPRFRNPVSAILAPTTAGDYRLMADSQAIDAGNAEWIPSVLTDLDGNDRVVNGRIDQGAYEFQLFVTLTPDQTAPTGSDVSVAVDVESGTATTVTSLKWARGAYDIGSFPVASTADVEDHRFTVAENDTYSVYIADSSGYTKVTQIVIANISKTKPNLQLSRSTLSGPYEAVKINIDASANGPLNAIAVMKVAAGEQDASFFAAGGTPLTFLHNGTMLTDISFTVFSSGIYTVYVGDLAGGTTVKQIEIVDYPAPPAPTLPVITVVSGVPFSTMIYDPKHIYVGTFDIVSTDGITGSVTVERWRSYAIMSGTLTGNVRTTPAAISLGSSGLQLHVLISEPPQAEGTYTVGR